MPNTPFAIIQRVDSPRTGVVPTDAVEVEAYVPGLGLDPPTLRFVQIVPECWSVPHASFGVCERGESACEGAHSLVGGCSAAHAHPYHLPFNPQRMQIVACHL